MVLGFDPRNSLILSDVHFLSRVTANENTLAHPFILWSSFSKLCRIFFESLTQKNALGRSCMLISLPRVLKVPLGNTINAFSSLQSNQFSAQKFQIENALHSINNISALKVIMSSKKRLKN